MWEVREEADIKTRGRRDWRNLSRCSGWNMQHRTLVRNREPVGIDHFMSNSFEDPDCAVTAVPFSFLFEAFSVSIQVDPCKLFRRAIYGYDAQP